MKTSIKFFLISIFINLSIILMYCPENSKAENWSLFYNSQDEEKYYLDKESIEKLDKKIIRVWQKKVKVEDDKEIEMEREKIEIDCNKRTYKKLTEETKDPKAISYKPIIGGSRMDALFDNVCYIK